MDVAAWNTLLDATYGPDRAAGTPDAFEVVLSATQDPASEIPATTLVDDVEEANGYARVTLDNDDWLAADEGVKVSEPVTFPAPLAAWETVRWAHLYDPVTETWWNSRPLRESLTVTGAGDPPIVRVNVAAGGLFEG